MQFTHPQLLILIVPVLVWTWWCIRNSLKRTSSRWILASVILRSAVLVLVVTAAADPQILDQRYSRKLILVADQSPRLADWTNQRSQTFAEDLNARLPVNAEVRSAKSDSLINSIITEAETVTPEKSAQFVVFTDGHTSASKFETIATRLGVPVSIVPVSPMQSSEWAISELNSPEVLDPGETFEVEVIMFASEEIRARIEIFSDSVRVHNEEINLQAGYTTKRFPCVASETRIFRIEARISSDSPDRVSANNRMSAATAVRTKPRVLLVSDHESSIVSVRSAIETQLIQTVVKGSKEMPATVAEWTAYDAVILSNIPAAAFSNEQTEFLRQYVAQFGGGLIVAGGDRSFTAGNYGASPLNDLLPVDSRDDETEDRPTRAIAILIDKSASMDGLKLEMAAKAAASVIGTLRENDELAVIGFDAVPHVVIPLQPIRELDHPEELINAISANGGTTLDPAIETAFGMLSRSGSSQRHVILLTDGASTDQAPEAIVSEMSLSGVTLSVIAIGDDADELLLETLSEAGRGRYWQTSTPEELPRIVQQDADSAAIPNTITEPTVPMLRQATPALRDPQFQTFPVVNGFVKTTPGTTSDLILANSDGLPILASWQHGLGTVVAFTSDIEGRWTTAWETWPPYARFWSQIIRYAGREHMGGELELQVSKDAMHLDMVSTLPSSVWNAGDVVAGEVQFLSSEGTILKTSLVPWDQQRQTGTIELTGPGLWIAEAEIQTETQTFRTQPTPVVIDSDATLRPKMINEQLLREISTTTGGLYNPAPDDLLKASVKPGIAHETGREETYCLAVFLWLIDVVTRRVLRGRGAG